LLSRKESENSKGEAARGDVYIRGQLTCTYCSKIFILHLFCEDFGSTGIAGMLFVVALGLLSSHFDWDLLNSTPAVL
jgi:hypothetical protein